LRRTHAEGSPAAARLARPMGLAGLAAGPKRVGGLGRASGSAQSGRFSFFFEKIFSVQKNSRQNSSNSFKALKILRKSQKLQENS
jgi:hypothetical protein